MRYLTEQDLEEYEWIDVETHSDIPGKRIRGLKKTKPPDDGKVYVNVDPMPGDNEYRWIALYTDED